MSGTNRYPTPSGSDAKAWARENVRDQWCALMLPVTKDDRVDEEGIRTAVRKALQLEIGGLAYSSLMEPWSSTHEERKIGLEIFLDELAGRKPVYVTITDHSVKETVALGQHALEHGAAIVLFNVPYEHAKSEEQIHGFFEYVCNRLDGPVALYNTPHSGYILSPDMIARLAQIENVCAIKNAIHDIEHSDRTFRLAGDTIVVNYPDEQTYLENIIKHGQQTLFSCTATHLLQSPAWQPIEEYSRLARAGDIDRARAVRHEIGPLRAIREEIYNVLWQGDRVEHPSAYLKYWQELMGYPAGPPRPPLLELSESQKATFRERLEATRLMERFKLADWYSDAVSVETLATA
jgi:4-hydroxy-tetrahydrodipicolinate synthase